LLPNIPELVLLSLVGPPQILEKVNVSSKSPVNSIRGSLGFFGMVLRRGLFTIGYA
jgi:hypothetical protein